MVAITKVVLTTDRTLTSTYRDLPLIDFLPCAPVEWVPKFVYDILDTQLPHENGILLVAPYSLRKVEAALLANGYREDEVKVVHPDYVTQFIDDETKIVGISTMDPFGLGPVTLMFTAGGLATGYTKHFFTSLVRRIDAFRRKRRYRFKIVVGGAGAWQLKYRWDETKALGVDHVVIGEVEHVISSIFEDVINDSAPELIEVPTFPKVHEIPRIVRPSYKGMVEVMRGCGRGCQFCEPNLRYARYFDLEDIAKEVKVNLKAGIRRAWLHSDDIFMYKVKDRRNFYPNSEEIIELFKGVMQLGLKYVNPTHGGIASVVADPKLIKELSKIIGASPTKWIGIQVGMETGSTRMMRKYMALKARPFSPDEWPYAVIQGTYILNKYCWFPAYTLVFGLPGETDEDVLETVQLIVTMNKLLDEKLGKGRSHFTVTPLCFVPLGVLKDKGFFDIMGQLTEARFLLIYHCWRRTLRELYTYGNRVFVRNSLTNLFILPIANAGARILIEYLRVWGRRMGYDPDKPIKPLDIKIPSSTLA